MYVPQIRKSTTLNDIVATKYEGDLKKVADGWFEVQAEYRSQEDLFNRGFQIGRELTLAAITRETEIYTTESGNITYYFVGTLNTIERLLSRIPGRDQV